MNRFTSWHKATAKALARNVILCQRIRTTREKAKLAQRLVEKLISLAKKDNLAARRQAQKILGEHNTVSGLFNEIAPLFAARTSGFTRIINLGSRRGDNAPMVILELTEIKKKEARKPKKDKAVKSEGTPDSQGTPEEKPADEKKPSAPAKSTVDKKKEKKTGKKFLGGLRGIFKKGRNSK